MSWILVIPFDVIKTVVQAETDPYKHGNIAQIFKAKTDVSCKFLQSKHRPNSDSNSLFIYIKSIYTA